MGNTTMTTTKTRTMPDQEICAPPTERVPILLEITEEDRQKAGSLINANRCLIATAIRRMGYRCSTVGGGRDSTASVNDSDYQLDISDVLPDVDLDALIGGVGPFYKPGVVGKQFILYPI